MTRWNEIPFDPDRKTLRQFAALWLLVFLAMAGWEWRGLGPSWRVAGLALLAISVGMPGLWKPGIVRPIFVTWMVLAFPIGWSMSWLTLGCLFYGVFTPAGFLLRLAGHDPLGLDGREGKASYWKPKPAVTDLRRYFRQY